jgi:hypothetical protein
MRSFLRNLHSPIPSARQILFAAARLLSALPYGRWTRAAARGLSFLNGVKSPGKGFPFLDPESARLSTPDAGAAVGKVYSVGFAHFCKQCQKGLQSDET